MKKRTQNEVETLRDGVGKGEAEKYPQGLLFILMTKSRVKCKTSFRCSRTSDAERLGRCRSCPKVRRSKQISPWQIRYICWVQVDNLWGTHFHYFTPRWFWPSHFSKPSMLCVQSMMSMRPAAITQALASRNFKSSNHLTCSNRLLPHFSGVAGVAWFPLACMHPWLYKEWPKCKGAQTWKIYNLYTSRNIKSYQTKTVDAI